MHSIRKTCVVILVRNWGEGGGAKAGRAMRACRRACAWRMPSSTAAVEEGWCLRYTPTRTLLCSACVGSAAPANRLPSNAAVQPQPPAA